MKKPELTIEKVIEALESNTCYECAYGCIDSTISCEAECFYKDAMIKAIEYLKVLLAVNDQIAQIQTSGYKFVIGRNWERGTDANS